MDTLKHPVTHHDSASLAAKKEGGRHTVEVLFKIPDVTRKPVPPSASPDEKNALLVHISSTLAAVTRFSANSAKLTKRIIVLPIGATRGTIRRLNRGGTRLIVSSRQGLSIIGAWLSNLAPLGKQPGKIAAVWISRTTALATVLAAAVCLVLGVQWIMSGPSAEKSDSNSNVGTSKQFDELANWSMPEVAPSRVAPVAIGADAVSVSETDAKKNRAVVDPLVIQQPPNESMPKPLRKKIVGYVPRPPQHNYQVAKQPTAPNTFVDQRGGDVNRSTISSNPYNYPQTQPNAPAWGTASHHQPALASRGANSYRSPATAPAHTADHRARHYDNNSQNAGKPIGMLRRQAVVPYQR